MSVMQEEEGAMGFGRGALLWLLGVPLPVILLLNRLMPVKAVA